MVGWKSVDDRGFDIVAMRKVAAGKPVPAGQDLAAVFDCFCNGTFERLDRLLRDTGPM